MFTTRLYHALATASIHAHSVNDGLFVRSCPVWGWSAGETETAPGQGDKGWTIGGPLV